nr:GNAT family N-acetyltransferase [Pseudohongiella spirulinae]
MLRDARASDAGQIAHIYNYYVLNTVVTFEEKAVPEIEMASRISDVQGLGLPWLVAEDSDGAISGYAYAVRWKTRAAYKFSVETTVYTDPELRRNGLGTMLYSALFERLMAAGIHSAVGGICLPNDASVALHEKMGMKQIARFNEIGFKAGQWLDVGYWQRIFTQD